MQSLSTLTPLPNRSSENDQRNNSPKIPSVFQRIRPLTLSFQDNQGHTIQLWTARPYGLIGSVLNSVDQLIIIPGTRICTPLNPGLKPEDLVDLLEKIGLRKWDFAFDTCALALTIWPHLEAAGKKGVHGENRPIKFNASAFRYRTEKQIENYLKAEGFTYYEKDPRETIPHWERPIENEWVNFEQELRVHIDPRHRGSNTHEPDHLDIRFTGEKQRLAYERLTARKEETQTRRGALQEEIKKARNTGNATAEKELVKERSGLKKELDLKWRFAFGEKPPRDSPPDPKNLNNKPYKTGPAQKQFEQTLQQTKLTSSYKSTHPHNPIPEKGGTNREIGGVACSTDYIQGLFDTPETLFEQAHFFCLPRSPEGIPPFSDEELRQILRELAIGVYVHSTIPFFSLHFNQKGDLFPVIHPVYKNTLVGRVIGMLDYIMKGYLHGGVFEEPFIQDWYKDPNWKNHLKSVFKQMIDFENYCKQHLEGEDRTYLPLKDLEYIATMNSDEPKILRDYSEFGNSSFRIIAKQKSIQKSENLFVIDADFDVFYTLNPSPKYHAAHDQFRMAHGRNSSSYENLNECYKEFCQRIHDHLIKFPLCRKYFSMLSVINFFSGYFSTLKKHRKIPNLPAIQALDQQGCPPLFPHFPLRNQDMTKFTLARIYNHLGKKDRKTLKEYLLKKLKLILEDESPYSKSTVIQDSGFINLLEGGLLGVFSKVSPIFQTHLKPLFARQALRLRNDAIDSLQKKVEDLELNDHKEHAKLKRRAPARKTFIRKFISEEDCSGELSQEDAKAFVSYVGGCEQSLKQQIVEPSAKAEQIFRSQKNFSTLETLEPESWTKIKMDSGIKGDVFCLGFEDALPWVDDDYSWMELLLLPFKGGEERLNAWIKVLEALRSNKKEDFEEGIKQDPSLLSLQDHGGRTLLHHSVLLDDIYYTKFLLQKGIVLDAKDSQGYLPLHYASMRPNSTQLKLLIEHNQEHINSTSLSGATPLVVAIQHNRIENVRVLLDAGATNVTLFEGYNVLHCALHDGYVEIAYLLLNSQVIGPQQINECANEGGTPLMLACELDLVPIVEELIIKKADPVTVRKDGKTALEIAILRNCAPLVDFLIHRSSWVPSDSILKEIAKNGSVEIIQIIQKHPNFYLFRVSLKKETMLHSAIRNGNVGAAFAILSQADFEYLKVLNADGESALDLAIQAGFWDLIQALVIKGIEIDQPKQFIGLVRIGYHPTLRQIFQRRTINAELMALLLQEAAQRGNHEVIALILKPRGAKLEGVKGPHGWQILHYLAKCDGLYLFKRLVGEAKDLCCRDKEGKTTAYIAAENGSLRILSYLLEQMKLVKYSFENQFNDRHLIYAAIDSDEEKCLQRIFELVKEEDLSNKLIDHSGTRPAHLAAKRGSKEMLRFLHSQKADFTIQDNEGHTPLFYSIRAKAVKAVKFILNDVAVVSVPDLYAAASCENDAIWKFVSRHISIGLKEKNEALMLAVKENDIPAVVCLKANGVSPTQATSEDGWSPILWASAYGHPEMLEELLKDCSVLEHNVVEGKNPLDWACLNGHVGCVDLLLKAKYSLTHQPEKAASRKNAPQYSPGVAALLSQDSKYLENVKLFRDAVKAKDEAALLKLLECLPVNERIVACHAKKTICATPFQHYLRCASKVSRAVVDKMIKAGFKPNLQDSEGNTLAHLLVKVEDFPLDIPGIKWDKKNYRGQTPLHFAAVGAELPSFTAVLEAMPSCIHVKDRLGWTPIFYAIQSHKEDHVRLLIRKGSDLNLLSYDLMSVLFNACIVNDLSLIKMLVENGANVNQRNTLYRLSCLHYSIDCGNDEIAFYLLSQGANGSILDANGNSPMHHAAQTGNTSLIRYLTGKGCSPEAPDQQGYQPIHLASIVGDIKVLETLASMNVAIDSRVEIPKNMKGKKTNIEGITPLYLAALHSQTESVKWLLNHHANPEKGANKNVTVLPGASYSKPILELLRQYKLTENISYLHSACKRAITFDNVETLKVLIEWGISLNANLGYGYTCLHYASRFGALQCTQFLLQNGADANLSSDMEGTALEMSAVYGSLAQFKFLLNHCSMEDDFLVDKANRRGETLLHLAAKSGNLSHIVYLVMRGCNLEARDVTGSTPLHFAAREGKSEVVQFLVACGANMEAKSEFKTLPEEMIKNNDLKTQEMFTHVKKCLSEKKEGETLLHLAIKMKDPSAVLLHSSTNQVNQQDIDGTAPLHLAVLLNQPRTVRALLRNGAFVDIMDKKGQTPLWLACFICKDVKMTNFLFRQGASPHIKNDEGFSILERLKKENFSEKEDLLKRLMKNSKKDKGKEKNK